MTVMFFEGPGDVISAFVIQLNVFSLINLEQNTGIE